ncbi:MAG: flippase-like domain-containing protein [Fibromonadales bacterium]|nr:flippase-like domain-containing protein [Fibromonadales bacterium]
MKIKFAIKLAISVLLVILILWKFPVGNIIANLRDAKLGWVLFSFLLSELIILNQAFRWHYLLIVPKEQKPSFATLLKYTVVGYLFNVFAPGGVGADAYRSIALGKAHNVMASSVASVFVARIFGLMALCLLFWLALPYSEQVPEQAVWFLAAATLFLIIFCLCVLFNPFKKGKFGLFAEKLRDYRKYPLSLLAAFFGSLLMQILSVLMYFAVFKAIGISISWALLFTAIPVTILITAIPVSFNGIGVREWSLLTLTAYAINSEQLLASLLLGYAVVILQAVQGWLFFSFGGSARKTRET